MVVDLVFVRMSSGRLAEGGSKHIWIMFTGLAVCSGIKVYQLVCVFEDEDQILSQSSVLKCRQLQVLEPFRITQSGDFRN